MKKIIFLFLATLFIIACGNGNKVYGPDPTTPIVHTLCTVTADSGEQFILYQEEYVGGNQYVYTTYYSKTFIQPGVSECFCQGDTVINGIHGTSVWTSNTTN